MKPFHPPAHALTSPKKPLLTRAVSVAAKRVPGSLAWPGGTDR
jgi:hypothetical protein